MSGVHNFDFKTINRCKTTIKMPYRSHGNLKTNLPPKLCGFENKRGIIFDGCSNNESSTLLKTIRVSQMEKELEGQVKSVEKRFKPFERTDEPDLYKEIKEILQDVLTELYYSKGKKETPTSVVVF
jgi:hypothetical protein